MEDCEIHEYGLTTLDKDGVICPIERGTCPYEKERNEGVVEVSGGIICKSDGLVKKVGLIEGSKTALKSWLEEPGSRLNAMGKYTKDTFTV